MDSFDNNKLTHPDLEVTSTKQREPRGVKRLILYQLARDFTFCSDWTTEKATTRAPMVTPLCILKNNTQVAQATYINHRLMKCALDIFRALFVTRS